MQGSHLPLRKWFLAAYLMATHSNGISALQIQSKLGVSYKTAWLLLHKLRRAMVAPDRSPLSGTVEVDETAIPYRRKDDPTTRGGGSSTATQLWVAAAVETVGKFGVGRIRLARINDRSAASLVPFVVANTAPGSNLRTDGNRAYDRVPDRPLTTVNLSQAQIPAHLLFKWPHLVFANLKIWALGTFHGLRDRHIDAYLDEFTFRWNRRRAFRTTFDTMLTIGSRIGRVTYRDIVGDTSEWKKRHIDDVLDMCHPNKRQIVTDLARYYRVDRLEVLENLRWWVKRLSEEDRESFHSFRWDFLGVREFEGPRRYRRKKPRRPVLVPRRQGEERAMFRRYPNPDARVPRVLLKPRPRRAAARAAAE